jgi:hypothetical protein
VFEHARPGHLAALGDVADQEHRAVALLGVAGQPGGRFADLGHAAGRAARFGDAQRLDRIDHHHLRCLAHRLSADRFDVGLGEQAQAVACEAETPRAQRHLLR